MMSPYWMFVGWAIGVFTGWIVGANFYSQKRRSLDVTAPSVIESAHAVSSRTVRIEFADGRAIDMDFGKR